jgi:hypothetical protein
MNISGNPKTTLTGASLGIGGVILALLPPAIQDACMDAITSHDNPLVIGGLVITGILLTVIGPSLAKNKEPDNQGEQHTPSVNSPKE